MDWGDYYNIKRTAKPSSLLITALSYTVGKSALDLGAGALQDTKYMLGKNFSVVAYDSSPLIHKEAGSIHDARLSIVEATFDTLENALPASMSFDIITSQWSLPFAGKKHMALLFNHIKERLNPGGIFTGQLFAIHDGWNSDTSTLAFHTKNETLDLLKDLHIILFNEIQKDKKTADGTMKHWHYFEFIAQKRN